MDFFTTTTPIVSKNEFREFYQPMESDVLVHSILPWIVGEEKSRMSDFMGRNVHVHGGGVASGTAFTSSSISTNM